MENNLDKLFKSKLGGQEPEFHPAAWDRMEGLLDDAGMVPARKKKPNRSRIIYLTLLSIGILLSVVVYKSQQSDDAIGEGSTAINTTNSNFESSINNTNGRLLDNITSEGTTNTSLTKTTEVGERKSDFSDNSVIDRSIVAVDKEVSNQRIKINKSNNKLSENSVDAGIDDTSEFNESNVVKNERETLTSPVNRNPGNENTINAIQEINAITSEETIQNPIIRNENQTLTQEDLEEEKNSVSTLSEIQLRESIEAIGLLSLRSGNLVSSDRLIHPQIQLLKPSKLIVGISAATRFGSGMGYAIGPYLEYNIGNGFAIGLGGQFDVQNYDDSPEMSVFDKVYSFGSKLTERKFSLGKQNSLRVPVTLRRSFSGFSITTGLMVNKVFLSEGVISNMGEPPMGSPKNISIDNEMINPLTISLHLGGSINVSRYFALDLGIEYKSKAFANDSSISNDFSKFYPTLGLRYKLFKF